MSISQIAQNKEHFILSSPDLLDVPSRGSYLGSGVTLSISGCTPTKHALCRAMEAQVRKLNTFLHRYCALVQVVIKIKPSESKYVKAFVCIQL